MELEIRFYTDADACFIADLEKECFADPWSQNAIIEAAQYGTVFLLAEENGKIVGYLGMKPVLDEGYISNVAVTNSARGKGIGSALLQKLDEYAKENGIRTISLEVRPSNAPAIALYEKFGYKQVGRRKNFYSHPTEDGLILTKEAE
ncbi:MAG: ribosomal protein S18-alanine N-acetyltransferase [Clostridia bacterium]|nr:ribosomal protein S18-alanine N-acetyltransferase [Clostridia bacterium]